MIRTKHFALSWGYNVGTDTRYGLTIGMGAHQKAGERGWPRWRNVFSVWFDRPQFRWISETWRMNEPGCLQGLPIARQGIRSSAWTGRDMTLWGVDWQRGWSFHRHE
jgi:hypothetical protein